MNQRSSSILVLKIQKNDYRKNLPQIKALSVLLGNSIQSLDSGLCKAHRMKARWVKAEKIARAKNYASLSRNLQLSLEMNSGKFLL